MANTTERQLRAFALILTAILLLQFLWSGLRLLQTTAPQSIHPAAASLQVDDIEYGLNAGDESPQALVNRPLFWEGRHAYVSDLAKDTTTPVDVRGSAAIDQITLRGLYTGGIIISYQGQGRRLRLGESVEDWKLMELRPGAAVFRSGEDSRTVKLKYAFSVASAPEDAAADEPVAGVKDVSGARDKTESTERNKTTGE